MQVKNNGKLTIPIINKQVENKNITCLSADGRYENNKSNLKWQCLLCEYVFEYSKNFIDRSFTGCKNCRYIKAIGLAQSAAKQKGGICLTPQYTGSHDKILCQCKNGHVFSVAYNNMVNLGHWCPTCSDEKLVCEQIVKGYFENLFGETFYKIRPIWLRKDNGYCLELDGYCEKLNLAFEHNGEYHYVPGFKNKDFSTVCLNDVLKRDLCIKNGVNLIIVPSLFHRTPINRLRDFILDRCADLKIYVPYPDVEIDLSAYY